MTEPQPLSQLRDIHLPDPVNWWPLAPGWYLLMGIAFIGVMVLTGFIYRYYANGRAKRQALKLLAVYQQDYLRDGDSQSASAKVSELLRRVALVYFPREQVASLKGDEWLAFLNRTGQNINFNAVRDCLLELPYQTQGDVNVKPLLSRAKAWIQQRGAPCSS
ncbi:DUF4381 domain-containing protein [Legionella taurinensis]|uniref:DUF4381 domain-containing protein n=1 Tax=Legionella taurinensis TaxID=70611 RepID=A0A3A5L6V2_9GAMM|nr:DUF4381 domain-containing protein [Legionella taurinensis]MDX1835994.1 DUF4381 domain-containing protein [Legionella taurinensis]PUT38705.1 DUF4381 domain-containing protein [Legionella taurinensis]PUT40084.1 DUF4381 domain-containing protein [Legionella taurinensis]PUT42236.1 DUF4381 domain-containing protein [Legionella taurinensis]PUT46008.1 DUF4381 domain-containing protein [Legionella taurinensis]